MDAVKIGLIQMQMADDAATNLARARGMVRTAAAERAKVICLPELYRTRYFPREERGDTAGLAETVPGESTSAFAQLARELEVVIVVPLFETDSGHCYNSACVIDADGSVLGTYRKIHIPHDPFFYERSYFEPGDLGYRVFESRYLRFAVLICYDQWFPEAARAVALAGADAIFYPTAIGHLDGDPYSADEWLAAWTTVQRGHAIANGIHVAAVNRTGRENEISFWGHSFVCDAFGRVLAEAPADEEHVLTAVVDPAQNREIREGWGFLSNRRPETYGSLVRTSPATPRTLGLSMPAEWERHSSTWLAWPHDQESFSRLEEVEESYLTLIDLLHRGEQIDLIVRDDAMQERVLELLRRRKLNLSSIRTHVYDYADVWIRDYGPIFVTNRAMTELAMVHWRFNAWGGKYPALLKDERIPELIHAEMGMPVFEPGIVLEGGSVDVNGLGTALVTEQCLLSPDRNPELGRSDIEFYLSDYLGVSHVIWLLGGITGDDTDGHVDNVARFVGRATVVCAVEGDPEDENYAVLQENLARLRAARDQNGSPLTVIPMPMPDRISGNVTSDTGRLPASYLNFYVGNKVVLLPAFGSERDRRALEILREAFPERTVVGVDCGALLEGLGGIHCVTQQQPALLSGSPGSS